MAVAQTASAAAQTSIRQTASPTRPRRSEPIMNGNAGTTFRIGTSTGAPISMPARYDTAVPATIAAGTNAGFIPKDYTPRHEARCRSDDARLRAHRPGLHVERAGPARAS